MTLQLSIYFITNLLSIWWIGKKGSYDSEHKSGDDSEEGDNKSSKYDEADHVSGDQKFTEWFK